MARQYTAERGRFEGYEKWRVTCGCGWRSSPWLYQDDAYAEASSHACRKIASTPEPQPAAVVAAAGSEGAE